MLPPSPGNANGLYVTVISVALTIHYIEHLIESLSWYYTTIILYYLYEYFLSNAVYPLESTNMLYKATLLIN